VSAREDLDRIHDLLQVDAIQAAIERAERAERERDQALRVLRRVVSLLHRHDCEDGGFDPGDFAVIGEARRLCGVSDG